ncbi:MAG TPA: hypothetical protein VEJ42_00760 [Streptosporangiaceae bacterium]|nr:hypothetical protein [Streptosporangiaceae bacterium]HXZ63772.1 hypothetical protein [Streptosporangiaceae bacterium]
MAAIITSVTFDAFDSHTVMADPEGNVFCVELGPGDQAGSAGPRRRTGGRVISPA